MTVDLIKKSMYAGLGGNDMDSPHLQNGIAMCQTVVLINSQDK